MRALNLVTKNTRPQARHDDDLPLPAPSYPLVAPSRYIGVTRTISKRSWGGARNYLVITFDLFADMEALGNGEVPVARGIPGFFNLSSGPNSKYSRFLRFLYPDGALPTKLGDLAGKAVSVEVVTVEKGSDGKDLSKADRYSRVSEVLARE